MFTACQGPWDPLNDSRGKQSSVTQTRRGLHSHWVKEVCSSLTSLERLKCKKTNRWLEIHFTHPGGKPAPKHNNHDLVELTQLKGSSEPLNCPAGRRHGGRRRRQNKQRYGTRGSPHLDWQEDSINPHWPFLVLVLSVFAWTEVEPVHLIHETPVWF